MLVTSVIMKSYLSIESSDTTYDDIIFGMMNAVTDIFDNYCNRTFEADDYTLYLDGNGTDSLYLPNYPINEITSIYVDTDRNFNADTELTSDNYVTYETEGIISLTNDATMLTSILAGKFPKTRQCVKIVANLGYASDSVPYDLQKAYKDQVKWLFAKWKDNSEGIVSYSTINNSVNLVEATDILPMVKMTLDNYRNTYHGCL